MRGKIKRYNIKELQKRAKVEDDARIERLEKHLNDVKSTSGQLREGLVAQVSDV